MTEQALRERFQRAKEYQEKGWSVLSVDTKKKENIGNFKNGGRQYRKRENQKK